MRKIHTKLFCASLSRLNETQNEIVDFDQVFQLPTHSFHSRLHFAGVLCRKSIRNKMNNTTYPSSHNYNVKSET